MKHDENLRTHTHTMSEQKISFQEISILLALKWFRVMRKEEVRRKKNEKKELREEEEKNHHQFGFEVSTFICLRVSKPRAPIRSYAQ